VAAQLPVGAQDGVRGELVEMLPEPGPHADHVGQDLALPIRCGNVPAAPL
jgi:hypothetical protein